MLRYVKILFFKIILVFFVLYSILVIDKGCKGPDLANILKVPKMLEKVLEYVSKP